jgi:hypothetical protein
MAALARRRVRHEIISVEIEAGAGKMDAVIESWKARRAMLARQLQMLESGEMRTRTTVLNVHTEQDIQRLKSWIAELDELLAEHDRHDAVGIRAP